MFFFTLRFSVMKVRFKDVTNFIHSTDSVCFFLSSITFFQGVTSYNYLNKWTKVVSIVIFITFLLIELFVFFHIKLPQKGQYVHLIRFGGLICFYCCYFIYSFVLFKKGNQIFSFILSNISKTSTFERLIIISSVILAWILVLITAKFVFVDTLINGKSQNYFLFVIKVLNIITYPRYLWSCYSAIIYSLIFYLTHLNNVEVLQSNCSSLRPNEFIIWFEKVNEIQKNYHQLDQLVSTWPFLWIIYVFFGLNSIIYHSFDDPMFMLFIIMEDFFYWLVTLVLICQCQRSLSNKIEQVKLAVAIDSSVDNGIKSNLVFLINKITTFHPSAGPFIKLHTRFIFSSLGSIFTFTLLFREQLDIRFQM